jgi:hypothetical protein
MISTALTLLVLATSGSAQFYGGGFGNYYGGDRFVPTSPRSIILADLFFLIASVTTSIVD